MKDSIAMLLGAGFSAPMGYPIGNQLNGSKITDDILPVFLLMVNYISVIQIKSIVQLGISIVYIWNVALV